MFLTTAPPLFHTIAGSHPVKYTEFGNTGGNTRVGAQSVHMQCGNSVDVEKQECGIKYRNSVKAEKEQQKRIAAGCSDRFSLRLGPSPLPETNVASNPFASAALLLLHFCYCYCAALLLPDFSLCPACHHHHYLTFVIKA